MELRGRFAEVERRLPDALAEERELAEALASWLTGPARLDPELGADMTAYGKPTSVIGNARRDLDRLQTELGKALAEIARPVIREHDELRGLQSDRSGKLNHVHVHSGSPNPAQLPPH